MKIYWVEPVELEKYLDKFDSMIKFMMFCTQYYPGMEPNKFMLVIDENSKSDSAVSSLSFSSDK